jgi:hypothetical protein
MNTTSAETEEYLRALSKKVIEKYSTIDDKRQRVNLLTAKLCGAVTVDVLLDKGKTLFLENALKSVQNELEMLSFALAQRKASIGKLESTWIVYITRNMGQDGDGHAHFDQIWRPNITINYMGVDQNIKF